MKAKHLMLCLTLALFAGCQSTPNSYTTPYDNPHYAPPPGTVIELHQALKFSPNNSRSNIQNGVALGSKSYDRFQPMCQFYLYESKEVMSKPRSIEPDRFTVIKSGQSLDYTLFEPIKVAYGSIGFGGPQYFGNMFDDEMGARTMITTMKLRSEKQPQVHELRCLMDDDPYLQNFVTINQMIKTLGVVATLHLPEVIK